MIELRAHAKINLGLEVTGRRDDGYHEVVTILQEIDLADRLVFRPADDLHLEVDTAGLEGETNLVLRAARLLQAATGYRGGAAITLEKRIPIAAGLGGGSSDAATTLRGLNRLWGLGLSEGSLVTLAIQLGSDVTFFLRGGTQLATGRGEILEALPSPRLSAVLVLCPVAVADKTRRLYQALRPQDLSSGTEVRSLAELLRAGRSVAERALPSSFARATEALTPGVREANAALDAAGAIPSLSGAGPTVLSLHEEPPQACQVADQVAARGFPVRVVLAVGRGERAPNG